VVLRILVHNQAEDRIDGRLAPRPHIYGLNVNRQVVLLLVDATVTLLLDCVSGKKVSVVHDFVIVLLKVEVHEVVKRHLLPNRKAFNIANADGVAHKSEVVEESVQLGYRVVWWNVNKEVAWIVGVRMVLHESVNTLSHHSGKKKIEGDIY
jgi:hypothetical protein